MYITKKCLTGTFNENVGISQVQQNGRIHKTNYGFYGGGSDHLKVNG